MIRHRLSVFTAALLGVGAVALGATLLEDLTVTGKKVSIRDGQSVMDPQLAEVTAGQKVTVLERQGKWVKVQAGAVTGWAQENELTPGAKKSGGNDLFKGLAGADGSANSTEMQEAAAGKGVGESTAQYAKANKIDPKKLDDLVKLREGLVNNGEVRKFIKDGNLK